MSDLSSEKTQIGEGSDRESTAAWLEKLTQLITLQQSQILAIQNPSQNQTIPPATNESHVHPNPIDVKFDGTNYGLWSQSVELYVKGQEKLKHITGRPQPPAVTDALYRKWEVDDSIVKGWLINSLEIKLRGSFIRYPTAKGVWEDRKSTRLNSSHAQ